MSLPGGAVPPTETGTPARRCCATFAPVHQSGTAEGRRRASRACLISVNQRRSAPKRTGSHAVAFAGRMTRMRTSWIGRRVPEPLTMNPLRTRLLPGDATSASPPRGTASAAKTCGCMTARRWARGPWSNVGGASPDYTLQRLANSPVLRRSHQDDHAARCPTQSRWKTSRLGVHTERNLYRAVNLFSAAWLYESAIEHRHTLIIRFPWRPVQPAGVHAWWARICTLHIWAPARCRRQPHGWWS